jgi:hypothetical protein
VDGTKRNDLKSKKASRFEIRMVFFMAALFLISADGNFSTSAKVGSIEVITCYFWGY